MDKVMKFKENKVLKEILADSFGGVLYNVANKNKYNATDTANMIKEHDELTASEKESLDGLVKGAINFIKYD